MATKLIGMSIPFEAIFGDCSFLLTGIEPDYEYEDNKRTDRVIGFKYEVVDTSRYDKIKVKVKGQKQPLVHPDDLNDLLSTNEKVLVEFINGVDKLYTRRMNGISSVEDSFSADDIRLAD